MYMEKDLLFSSSLEILYSSMEGMWILCYLSLLISFPLSLLQEV